jgi:hypothetical protein
LIYFLIKDPLKKHIEGIKKAIRTPEAFKQAATEVYVGAQ